MTKLPDVIYEVDECVNKRARAAFYRLKGYDRIGVKVYPGTLNKTTIEYKLARMQYLRKHSEHIPKPVKIIKVNIGGEVVQGIAMQFVDSYFGSLTKRSEQEFYLQQYNQEVTRLGTEGIIVRDSEARYYLRYRFIRFWRRTLLGRNIVFCSKRKKFYFIDFEFWQIKGFPNL